MAALRISTAAPRRLVKNLGWSRLLTGDFWTDEVSRKESDFVVENGTWFLEVGVWVEDGEASSVLGQRGWVFEESSGQHYIGFSFVRSYLMRLNSTRFDFEVF